MAFAKTAAEAWQVLRSAICQGAVRAKGVLGQSDEAWFRGTPGDISAVVAKDLELVPDQASVLQSRNLTSSQWYRVLVNADQLQNTFPAMLTGGALERTSFRGSKARHAAEVFQRLFPAGAAGKSKKEVVTAIFNFSEKAGLRVSEKTIGRAISHLMNPGEIS
jgi:hypothetical protein